MFTKERKTSAEEDLNNQVDWRTHSVGTFSEDISLSPQLMSMVGGMEVKHGFRNIDFYS